MLEIKRFLLQFQPALEDMPQNRVHIFQFGMREELAKVAFIIVSQWARKMSISIESVNIHQVRLDTPADVAAQLDEFGFFELYCNDENCDCRRVMFNVVSRKSQKTVAIIAYGRESRKFYAKWYRQNDLEIIREMQGPVLNSASHQSELAPALLEKVCGLLLTDPEYIARLKQHYRMFKEK